jgi:hypothetical protein
MSRKDYRGIAAILSETTMVAELRAELVARFVTFLADDNPRFSPTTFRAACEPVARYTPCAVFGSSLGTVWRVRDRETNGYVPTMPRTFVARASAQASADNLNRA